MSFVISTPSPRIASYASRQQADSPLRMKFAWPKAGFVAWWSITMRKPAASNTASLLPSSERSLTSTAIAVS